MHRPTQHYFNLQDASKKESKQQEEGEENGSEEVGKEYRAKGEDCHKVFRERGCEIPCVREGLRIMCLCVCVCE